ncbi:MAG: 50S ribosomal protein L35 [Deltaproteobacteria bacterium]|nr:50S ribosomal protein L35 [Deltaproteobacteria bacterium]
MPKMKTKRSAAKRIRKTGSGHFRRAKANLSHGMISKNRKRCRRLRKNDTASGSDERKLRLLLPYG